MKKISSNLRDLVFERDSYTCIFCERPASEVHHLIRRSQGGRNIPQNLVSICRVHHLCIHGERIKGVELTRADLEETAHEYLADYYAPDFYNIMYPTPF